MTTLDPTTGTFTLTHLNFIHLCVETRSYAAAVPILDNYIHSLPSRIPASVREGLEYSAPCADVAASGDYIHQGSGHTEKVTTAELQEYYVLGAMAYLGLRQFKKAQQMLEHVLVAPSSNVANGYMLEAYKKWVLVGCLVDSMDSAASLIPQSRPIQDIANGNAVKQIKSASKAYKALREAYKNLGNLSKLKAQIKSGAEIWAEVRCEAPFHKNRVLVSSITYISIGRKYRSRQRSTEQSNEVIYLTPVTHVFGDTSLKHCQQHRRHS
jgi:COP9 signalosome complex subunit 3